MQCFKPLIDGNCTHKGWKSQSLACTGQQKTLKKCYWIGIPHSPDSSVISGMKKNLAIIGFLQ